MDVLNALVAILQGACFLALAIVLPHDRLRRSRRAVAIGLVGTAALGVLAGALDPGERTLVTRHTYVGYERPSDLEPSAVHFPTGTFEAAGWQWPLPFLGFALLGLAMLWLSARWSRRSPWLLPALFAWAGLAAWLGAQVLAAPAVIVQPWGLPRFLWPASLLLTFELARVHTRFLRLFAELAVGIVALRLPVALLSVYASEHQLGTGLDISTVTEVVHPIARTQFEPPLEAGSSSHYFWLIWAEHVFAFPAFHLMSMAGIAFAAFMMRKHDAMAD